jgi:hypothetical protein
MLSAPLKVYFLPSILRGANIGVETKHRISGSGVESKPQAKEPFIHVENNV